VSVTSKSLRQTVVDLCKRQRAGLVVNVIVTNSRSRHGVEAVQQRRNSPGPLVVLANRSEQLAQQKAKVWLPHSSKQPRQKRVSLSRSTEFLRRAARRSQDEGLVALRGDRCRGREVGQQELDERVGGVGVGGKRSDS
jgi:hypothetical protein